MTKAFVLCGGPGTRLRPITYYFQKSMIPIGRSQHPLLEYVIRWLTAHKVRDIILYVDYKAEQIINYFNDGSRFNARLSYLYARPGEGAVYGLIQAYRQGLFTKADLVLVHPGDLLTDLDLSDMVRFHRNKKSDITLAICQDRTPPEFVLDENQFIKNSQKRLIKVWIGTLLINCKVLEAFEELIPRSSDFSDLVQKLIDSNYPTYAFFTSSEWRRVSSTDDYEKMDLSFVDRIERMITEKLIPSADLKVSDKAFSELESLNEKIRNAVLQIAANLARERGRPNEITLIDIQDAVESLRSRS